MGCIMTPMPNHLSTLKPRKEVWRTHSKTIKTTQNSVGKKSGVGMEQMRRMVRSVEMVRMSGANYG